MDVDLSSSITRVIDAVGILEELEAAGCLVTDELLACRVEIPLTQGTGIPHGDLLQRLDTLSDRHLTYDKGPLSFELTGTPGSPLHFLNDPVGEPASVFDGARLQVAQRAWQGDVGAATTLPGRWRSTVSVHLRIPFKAAAPQVAWRVIRTVSVLEESFAAYPWWRAAEPVREGDKPVIIVITGEQDVTFNTGSFCVASLERVQAVSIPAGVAARRSAVESSSAARLPAGIALPEELIATEADSSSARLGQALKPKAEACAWAWLSNSVAIEDAAGGALLEFFGYRRKSFRLAGDGYVAELGHAYDAYRWATAEESPDRVLSVRQVVSLQDGDALPSRPSDVVAAAEPLYRALRSSEVAVVLESQRQARTVAINAARQSAEDAQGAAKSAAERTIASLAAIAGIAVAHATDVLSPEDASGIAIGIASLFILLALWAVFVEGPPMSNSFASLQEDLPKIGHLLTAKEREEILGLSILKRARRSVIRIRIVAPIVYVLGAGLALGVAYVRFGFRWP